MRSRHKFVITAALLCHLFLIAPLVTSQAHLWGIVALQNEQGSNSVPGKIQLSASEGEPVNISSQQQEKNGDLYKLRHEVEITFRSYIIHPDTITYNADTGDVNAQGHINFEGDP